MFFYFALKALFVLEIFQILFWVFGLVGKRLDKEAKSTLKTYNITKWITNNYNTHTHMHVTHTTKFSQLVENNMRNVVEKPCTKCDGETSPRPFFKKSKLSWSMNQKSEVSYRLLYCLSKSSITKTCWN